MPTDLALPAGRIPLLGLGTWRLSGDSARSVVRTALQLGYRHLDTATMYDNEAEIGAALAESGVPRSEVFVTTKIPAERFSGAREVLAASLAALGLDSVDLWLAHWPPDDVVPAWEAMRELRDEGLTRAIGVSNYAPAQIDELIEATGEAPAVNQIRWSPYEFDRAVLEHSRAAGVVLEGYSPFRAGGIDDPVVTGIAESRGRTPAQVVLRWHVQQGVVVIPKSANPDRLAANLDVFDFELTDEEMAAVDALAR